MSFTKQPREVVDYDLDMEDYFEDLTGDQVASVVVEIDTVTVPPLEAGPGTHPEYALVGDPKHLVKIWLGGGLDGSKYKITALITTDLERVEEVEFNLKVKET
jgi:hypothetical protein